MGLAEVNVLNAMDGLLHLHYKTEVGEKLVKSGGKGRVILLLHDHDTIVTIINEREVDTTLLPPGIHH
jgi:hypothetical protein